jgi:CheY-like chemotaxis protein
MSEILIVEDTESDAALLERALRTAGIANPIRRFTNGADTVAFLHSKQTATGKERVGIVLIDLKLPDISGFEILKVMQGRIGFAETLRVVVSSLDNMESIKAAYLNGADSFISKPPNHVDLQELIRSFPEHWLLVDPLQPPSLVPQKKRGNASSDEAVRVWSENREVIRKVRETHEMLRRTLDDNEETFVIIETLLEELRNKCASGTPPDASAKSKKRRFTGLLL